ncbi:hypothetical protein DRQ36_08760 [bacterium]|nr:MAG: hypothetical protein DRQ36_08760 [bacterium]
MRDLLILSIIISSAFASTEVGGDVSGVWEKSGSPYYITEPIYVYPGKTLIIKPGCSVIFKEPYFGFCVDSNAVLKAIGTEKDSIFFIAENDRKAHHGVHFSFSADGCSLAYCRIEGGVSTGYSSTDCGGGVACCNSNPTITHCTITGNYTSGRWGYGGGIVCLHSDAVIIHNTIYDNEAFHYGGGIACYNNSNPTITGNTIIGNSARWGGGIACYNNSNATIMNNLIKGNFAEGGGGIYAEDSDPTIVNNIIAVNTVVGKSSESWGGGICCGGANPIIINNTITENLAEGSGFGGGVFFWRDCKARLANNIIWGNTADNAEEMYIEYFGYEDSIDPCTVFVAYSNIDKHKCSIESDGGVIIWGEGNIAADPSYADTLYRLSGNSPCKNAGSESIYIPFWNSSIELEKLGLPIERRKCDIGMMN